MYIDKRFTNKFIGGYKATWMLKEGNETLYEFTCEYYIPPHRILFVGETVGLKLEEKESLLSEQCQSLRIIYEEYFNSISLNEEEFNDLVELMFDWIINAIDLTIKEKGGSKVCKI